LTADPIIQDSFVTSSARKAIDYLDEIKNTQIDSETLHELRARFQTLVDSCNSKQLRNFPVDIIDEPIDKISFEIRSTYFSKHKFSEVASFMIDSLKEAESHMDDGQCLDALCVLINYCNIVVYSRFDCGLALEPKKIDDWNSSNMISTQVNGEDSCIT
jgi:hypothetical protein